MTRSARRDLVARWCLMILVPGLPGLAAAQASPAASEDRPVEFVRTEIRDRIESDGILTRRQTQEIRLLTALGVQAYSQVAVTYFEATQDASLDAIVVIHPDGKEVDLRATAPTDVVSVVPSDLPMHSDLKAIRAALPILQVNDRLLISSTTRARPLSAAHVWTESPAYDPSSTTRLVYELDTPEDSALVVQLRKVTNGRLEDSRVTGRRIRRWTFTADTASSAAEGDPDPADLKTPEVQVTSFRDWDEMARWWAELSTKEIDEAVRRKAGELTHDAATERDRLAALYHFVRSEIGYLTLPLGLGRYQARDPGEVLRTGLGDCKDKIALLAALAQAQGISVESVLISSGNSRPLTEEVASPLQFDHVIGRVRLGDETVWLDPTSELTRFGRLPVDDRGVRGVLMHPGKGKRDSVSRAKAELVTTPERLNREVVRSSETVGSMDRSGRVRATIRTTFDGDEELVRTLFKYADERLRRATIEALQGGWGTGSKFGSIRFSDPVDLAQPFWFECDVEWPRGTEPWRSSASLRIPASWLIMNGPPQENLAGGRKAPRQVELDLPQVQRATARFELPEALSASAPVPVTLEREFASFRSTYGVEKNVLRLEREIRLKQLVVRKSDFAELQRFVDALRQDQRQEFDLEMPAGFVAELDREADAGERCKRSFDAAEYEKAVEACRLATEDDSQREDAWNTLGLALERLGRIPEARTAYRKQIEVDPHHGYAYANLGLLAWTDGDLKEAESLLRREISEAPFVAFAYGRLGRLLIYLGRYDEADTLLRQAVKLGGREDEIWIDRLELEARRGDFSAVSQMALGRPGLSAEPEKFAYLSAWLTNDLEGEADGLAELVGEGVSAAEKVLGGTIELPPSEGVLAATATVASAWEFLGRLALRRGEPAEARSWFEPALAFSQTSTAAEGFSRSLRAAGDVAEANRLLALAVNLEQSPKDRLEKEFQEAVPNRATRTSLVERAREGFWDLHGRSLNLPAAAGTQGEVWVLLAADGRVVRALATGSSPPAALAADLVAREFRIALPTGNRTPIPVKLLAFCDRSGACTLTSQNPAVSWRELVEKWK
ncbi:MAG: DUF3857 domain-containing protein [Thermoanaerobaculia bacterium]